MQLTVLVGAVEASLLGNALFVFFLTAQPPFLFKYPFPPDYLEVILNVDGVVPVGCGTWPPRIFVVLLLLLSDCLITTVLALLSAVLQAYVSL